LRYIIGVVAGRLKITRVSNHGNSQLCSVRHNPHPDIKAFREVEPGRWRRVRVEVEFHSRNFLQHFHDPKRCDLIVCWEHSWAEAPMEVVELKSVVLKSGDRA
jgi:hypothetical protein